MSNSIRIAIFDVGFCFYVAFGSLMCLCSSFGCFAKWILLMHSAAMFGMSGESVMPILRRRVVLVEPTCRDFVLVHQSMSMNAKQDSN